jgi:hypothetical protein
MELWAPVIGGHKPMISETNSRTILEAHLKTNREIARNMECREESLLGTPMAD